MLLAKPIIMYVICFEKHLGAFREVSRASALEPHDDDVYVGSSICFETAPHDFACARATFCN